MGPDVVELYCGKRARRASQRETYHLFVEQVDELRRLSLELQLDGDIPGVNKSLIARCALRWLLSMSADDLVSMLADQVDYERKQGHG
jgi:hypothetical protein